MKCVCRFFLKETERFNMFQKAATNTRGLQRAAAASTPRFLLGRRANAVLSPQAQDPWWRALIPSVCLKIINYLTKGSGGRESEKAGVKSHSQDQ